MKKAIKIQWLQWDEVYEWHCRECGVCGYTEGLLESENLGLGHYKESHAA